MGKQCKECKKTKPVENFYGLQGECKECTKARVKKRESILMQDPAWRESEQKRGRDKYRRLYAGTGKGNAKSGLNWIKKFPEKRLAHLRSSRIKEPGKENHHWSYHERHWKDVIHLTKKEHMKVHRFLIYDQPEMTYRRKDTNELLDTKKKHLTFITYCIKNKED